MDIRRLKSSKLIKESLKILSAITFLCLPGEVICDESQAHIDSNRLSDETECRSNTKQIRDIMDVIKKQHNPSHDTLKKLTTLLEKNLYFFEKYNIETTFVDFEKAAYDFHFNISKYIRRSILGEPPSVLQKYLSVKL